MPRQDYNKHEWKIHAKQGKIGFAVFLLIVGFFWLLKDLGYIPTLPFWPLVVIFFALFLLLNKM
jgi:hypothetical protein